MKKPDPKLELVVAKIFADLRSEAHRFLRDTEPGQDIGRGLRAVSRLEKGYERFVTTLKREMESRKK